MAGRELETTDGKAQAQEMGTQQRAGAARDRGRHARHLSGTRRARGQQQVPRPQSSGGLSYWARGSGQRLGKREKGRDAGQRAVGLRQAQDEPGCGGAGRRPCGVGHGAACGSSLARGVDGDAVSRRPALGWGRPRAPPHRSSAPPRPGPRCPGCPGRGCRPLCCSRSRRPCRPGSAGACGW